MERLDGNKVIPERYRGGVVALGNFDGFHLGHQAVVGKAISLAKERGVPALVVTFDPHPIRHFKPDAPYFRLTTLDQRQDLFAGAGADAMVIFHFGAELAGVSAEAFITDWLIGNLGAVAVVTGEDFTFGKGRTGSIETLKQLGAAHGLSSHTVGPVADAGGTVSSSRIREALMAGDCELAARLLTRPFRVAGIVQHGDKNGRKLGFPTANIDMGHYIRPLYGIYAITAHMVDGRYVQGVANLGIRPSFQPPKELLEPHFFDFSEDVYGQSIEIEFRSFIRPEMKFDNLNDLIIQMNRDCENAKGILKRWDSGESRAGA